MPTYDYICKKCGKVFEVMTKMNDKSKHDCPNGHKKSSIRSIGKGGFILKGNGFYNTEYKKG